MTDAAAEALDRAARDEWGRLLALLVARTRRLDLAEDGLADAFEAAARVWPREGVPASPPAWLMTTARRRVLDRLRAESLHARRAPLLDVAERERPGPVDPAVAADGGGTDELVRLVLLCTHPALSPEAGTALTLRLVMGVPTPDIAAVFLVPEPTMAARITRAKKKIVAAGLPFALPPPDELPARLDAVGQVAYLAFTAGYAPSTGGLVTRVDLAADAIRLVRLVRSTGSTARSHPGLTALLALMLFQHSRRNARVDADGTPVVLPDQDRSSWHTDEIAEARRLLASLGRPPAPPTRVRPVVVEAGTIQSAAYVLQALIAQHHATADTAADTDWAAICQLYRELEDLTGSPVVRLNRAVAQAERGDVTGALSLLDGIDAALPHSHRVPAVRGELLARAGEPDRAAEQLQLALDRCDNEADRRALSRRLDDLR